MEQLTSEEYTALFMSEPPAGSSRRKQIEDILTARVTEAKDNLRDEIIREVEISRTQWKPHSSVWNGMGKAIRIVHAGYGTCCYKPSDSRKAFLHYRHLNGCELPSCRGCEACPNHSRYTTEGTRSHA